MQAIDMATARDRMNDYSRISYAKKPWRRFTPQKPLCDCAATARVLWEALKRRRSTARPSS